MEFELAVKKIQYAWRLHRAYAKIDELLFAEVNEMMINRLRTLQRTFQVKLRKRILEALVSNKVRQMERVQERERITASTSSLMID